MALIKCKECGKEFSDKANACIHCGCPIEKDEKKTFCIECGNQLNASDKVCNKCGCPIESNDKINNKVNNNAPKRNKGIDIVRYCVGLFCLLFTMSTKGIGIILILLAVALILPITSKFIYEKINIPKALKIIIPIVLIIVSMTMSPSFKKGFEEGRNKANGTTNDNQTTNENNSSSINDVIIGEWRLTNNDYFEFFNNGVFYYTGSTSNMVQVSSACTIKGKYEQTSDTIIRLYDYKLISDIDDLCKGLNEDYSEYFYSFPSDYSQMCGNTNGFCMSGYKKISSTPSKLDKDGKKVS